MPKIDFNEFARQLALNNGRNVMAPVIEKELLHYEILRAMEEDGLLAGLVFQGGTCLRLCFGASRYSEDLDFAGGVDFGIDKLHDLKACIENALPRKYFVTADIKEPTNPESLVKKWRIKINTTVDRPDISTQKISLEVASIPAHTKQARMLQLNYEGLPSSYEDVVLFTESLDEILADKLEAFACSPHVRYRDLWDMHWLARRPTINLDKACELRRLKEVDYGETEKFAEGINRVDRTLFSLIESDGFSAQMRRFLPYDQFERTIARHEFRAALTTNIQELYARCRV